MKNSLLFKLAVILLFVNYFIPLTGQSIVFSEDFPGFSTGTHEVPSTKDASTTLDAKTIMPGWAGSLVYPAGGEVKIGTSTATGWIETPLIDLSSTSGDFVIRFDIARWPGDAATVKVFYNNEEKGGILTPVDEFSTIEITCTGEDLQGKVRFEGITKRFYIDNLVITSNMTTSIGFEEIQNITIYPVPANDFIIVKGLTQDKKYKIEIIGFESITRKYTYDLSGNDIKINVASLPSGIYMVRIISGGVSFNKRFIKAGN